MEKYYKIASHYICVKGCDEWIRTVSDIDGLIPFEVELNGEKVSSVFRFTDEEAPEMTQVQYESGVDGIVDIFGRYAEGYLFSMIPPEGEPLHLWLPDGETTVFFGGQLMSRLVRFGLWIAYGLIALSDHTLAIHTSAILFRGKVVLFLGESGTGKSTHTRLWREHIAGATLLNDDSPIVRIEQGVPMVYGSPWSGKTPCYRNECYPLAACVRLSQAPHNDIKRLGIAQAYAALHPSCPPDFAYDNALYDAVSDSIGGILAAVPLYHLECLPDADAAYLSCKTIFGE